MLENPRGNEPAQELDDFLQELMDVVEEEMIPARKSHAIPGAAYEFHENIRGEDLDIFYEGEGIAIDVTPDPEHERYRDCPRKFFHGYEVIMPVAEVENLIINLQTMVKTIRERFPDAA